MLVKEQIPEQSFNTWFMPIVPVKLEDSTLTIQVPSQFFYEWLEENYVHILQKVIQKVIGQNGKLEYSEVMDNGSASNQPYTFKVGGKKFSSRLIVRTGKYKNLPECAKAIKISGADIVTVAVRRVNISDKNKPLLMDYINPKKITYLPNTAGCFSSDEALRTLRLAREIGGWKLVKLEVLGDKKNLFPEMIETLKSTEILTKEGFKVMVYCNDDPLMAKRLENSGACAIMPLAAPIGSGLGIINEINIKIIRKQTKLPLIIDAGLGQASDAAIAMELGCDGVLVNTAIAKAKKPFQMALAFKNAVVALSLIHISEPTRPY